MGASTGAGTRSGRWPVVVILVAILLAAFSLRIFRVDWADGQLPHPDERSTVAFYAPSIRWPAEGISPLDKRQSPLNPLWDTARQERRSYTYGHFPLYLLVLVADGLHALAPVAERLGGPEGVVAFLREANGVPGFALVGRGLMAVADTVTVLFIFLLADGIYGRRPGRWWVGLLAAAFSAFTVLQIQLSHFFAVDPISTTFTVVALYGALRMVQAFEPGARSSGAVGWAVVAGVGAGLAIASKFSALPILAAPVVAGLLIWWHDWRARRRAGGGTVARPEGGRTGAATEGPPLPGERYDASMGGQYEWWAGPVGRWTRMGFVGTEDVGAGLRARPSAGGVDDDVGAGSYRAGAGGVDDVGAGSYRAGVGGVDDGGAGSYRAGAGGVDDVGAGSYRAGVGGVDDGGAGSYRAVRVAWMM